jgi:hypothetical protein
MSPNKWAQKVISNIVIEFSTSHFSKSSQKRKRLRIRFPLIDYSQSTWWRMMQNPDILVENSKVSDLFRLRFRVPYLLFRDILVPAVRLAHIFPDELDHRVFVPLEIKILLSLRILGRGNCADDISEMSLVPPSIQSLNSLCLDLSTPSLT